MLQACSKVLTLEEFLELPETEPSSEYIDGQIVQKPMPQGKHSRIQGELVSAINIVVKPKKSPVHFLSYAVPLEDAQPYLTSQYLFGIEFPVMKMEKLLMPFP